MRTGALVPLFGFVCNLVLAFFVLSRAPKATQNRVYFFLGLFISVWNLGQFFLFTTASADVALFWVRFLWVGVVFIPMLLFHLSMLLADTRVGRVIPAIYGFLWLLALTVPTPFFIKGVRFLGKSGWYAVAGPGLYIAIGMFFLMFVAIVILIRRRRTLPRVYGSRLTALIIAQSALSILGTNDTLPLIGWDYYPFTSIKVYPYGSVAAVSYGLIVAFSVLQNQLLGARIALSGTIAHFVRFTFLSVIAGGLLLVADLFTEVFDRSPGSFWVSLGVFVSSSIITVLVFPRMFGGAGMEKWEKRILGDRFEYEDQVRNFMENMAWYSDLDVLLNDLHEILTRIFKLQSYQFIVRDETSRVFTLFRSYPDQPQRQLPELRVQSPVFRFFEWGKAAYLTLNPEYLRPAASALEQQALEQLREFKGQFCFPLASQNEPFGLMVVGEKFQREPYTATDITLLVQLVKSLSLMVNQIRLKNHIMQTQELDLLGRMSRGMAHDLNNLLTPIWTLLQLSNEMNVAGGPAVFDEELLPSALRNLTSMRAYIKEALFFSENLRPDFQIGRLDVIIKQAADQARLSRKKPVQVITETPGEVTAELDEVLIQRLIANVISNAIDASPEGSTIKVELVRLAKTEASRDWLRVRVMDQGEGIRKEDLNRVFTPYFTTKTHGDEARGFGLGLAICRKIMNLHGGNLSIQSQLRKGTTVELDLPARQVKAQAQPLAQQHA
jgi:signal transduction histidine kinase